MQVSALLNTAQLYLLVLGSVPASIYVTLWVGELVSLVLATARRHPTSYDVTRLILMSPIDSW